MKYVKKVSPRLGFVRSALNSLGRGREDGVGDVERVTNEQVKTRFLLEEGESSLLLLLLSLGDIYCCCCCCSEQEWKIRV